MPPILHGGFRTRSDASDPSPDSLPPSVFSRFSGDFAVAEAKAASAFAQRTGGAEGASRAARAVLEARCRKAIATDDQGSRKEAVETASKQCSLVSDFVLR